MATHEFPHENTTPGDLFDEIVSGLEEQLTDPYLDNIHRIARQFQALLRSGGVDDTMRKQMIRHLDSLWEYGERQVAVSGTAWVQLPGEPQLVAHYYDEQPAISRGFITLANDTSSGREQVSVGHCVELLTLQARLPAVVPIDTLHHLELPYPSDELRERRFAYHFPEHAQQVEELAQTARRDDQMLRDLQEFSMTLDLDDPHNLEHARDGTQYLRKFTTIEPLANYKVAIKGDAPMIVVTETGDGLPIEVVSDGFSPVVHVSDIALRPRDTTVAELAGVQELTPYVIATALLPGGMNQGLQIPCSSIESIYSLRYASAP